MSGEQFYSILAMLYVIASIVSEGWLSWFFVALAGLSVILLCVPRLRPKAMRDQGVRG